MEDWEIDFAWLELRHKMKAVLGIDTLPDLKSLLFLVGVQEYGRVDRNFSKEEKRDLMHIAACALLEREGYYRFEGRDEDGWPHWELEKPFTLKGSEEQEKLLKKNMIEYFKKLDKPT